MKHFIFLYLLCLVMGTKVTYAQNPDNSVFGRNIFNSDNLTFEPSMNLPTPPDYRFGPEDEVIIDIWGTNQAKIRSKVSPDGFIQINGLGLLPLNGMTVGEASGYLRNELGKIYSSLTGDSPSSQLKVTLGSSRTIQINVMGEVVQPGTYSLSSFSTLFHALYRAGGVSPIGSLRSVQLVRGGKIISTVDVYDFIMKGQTDEDIHLQEGDVIIVPPFEALVRIEGHVKRPMGYEMKAGESIATLLHYAGGFRSDAYSRSLRLVRKSNEEYQVYTVDEPDYSSFRLHNGDVLTVGAVLDRYENRLEVHGAVNRPGIYQLGDGVHTVGQLIAKANGLKGDAFTERSVLHREREDRSKEILPLNIRGILEGSFPDVPLRRNDVLFIPSSRDLADMGSIQVSGEVNRPGEFAYADNLTLEDIVLQAGGLKDAASTVRVDVSRRIRNPKSTESVSTIGEMYSFSLKDGFVIDGTPGFLLQPYDQVYVRRSPGYHAQSNVSVEGEVLYKGGYTLTNKRERLSHLVEKAGGVTPFAYLKGAKLMRHATDEERKRMATVLEMMEREMGTLNTDSLKLNLADTYSVGIELEEAMRAPGSDADVVLRAGDSLVVPRIVNTVRINGAVLMANTVYFKEGAPVKYYIEQAGGYSNNARKSKVFIIYMNGRAAKVKGSGKGMVEPGCEIVVPIKEKVDRMSTQDWLRTAQTLASLGLSAASVANIMKK